MKKKNYIVVDINNKKDIFNKFNEKQISDGLAQYIITNAKKDFISKNVKLVIKQNVSLTTQEQEKMVDAIREYFGLLVREKILYLRINNVKQIVLSILGILLIIFSELLSMFFNYLIPELLLIAGWIVIWEALESILFVDSKAKIDKRIYLKLSNCEIDFK